MNLPFSKESFLQLFATYNTTIWPTQIMLNLLAIGILYLVFRNIKNSERLIPALLSLLWLFTGAVYHILFFATINPAAYGFGALFLIQGIIFAWIAYAGKVRFGYSNDPRGIAGAVVVLYALILYPALGYLMGHAYPSSPTFGAPCPTTIFTFGILIWIKGLPKYALVIPILWAIVGLSAALSLGMLEDLALPVSAALALFVVVMEGRVK